MAVKPEGLREKPTDPSLLPKNEVERLNYLRRIQILDTPQEVLFDDITLLASMICETPLAAVSFVDEDRQWLKSKIGLNIEQTARQDAFCAHSILQPEEIMIVVDTLVDDRFRRNPLVLGETKVRFYAAAPLVTQSGLALGTLCVYDTVPRELSTDQLLALGALRRSVISELELRFTTRELQQMVKRQSSLAEIELAINQPFELHQVLDQIVKFASDLLAVDGNASIILWDPEDERFFTSATTVPGQFPNTVRERIRRSGGASRWIVDHKKPMIVTNISQDPFSPNKMLAEFGLKSYIGVPLISEGKALGVLYSLTSVQTDYSEVDQEYLQALAQRAAIAVHNVQRFEAVQRLSIIDELTGIFNRRHLSYLARIEFSRARRYKNQLSIIMVDIDVFKEINDTLGHQQGDLILRGVVTTLQGSIRGADILGRYGGDELLLILPNTGKTDGWKLGVRLQETVEQARFGSNGSEAKTTIGLGGAALNSDHHNIDDLIEEADQAMYVSKRAGGNRLYWADQD